MIAANPTKTRYEVTALGGDGSRPVCGLIDLLPVEHPAEPDAWEFKCLVTGQVVCQGSFEKCCQAAHAWDFGGVVEVAAGGGDAETESAAEQSPDPDPCVVVVTGFGRVFTSWQKRTAGVPMQRVYFTFSGAAAGTPDEYLTISRSESRAYCVGDRLEVRRHGVYGEMYFAPVGSAAVAA